MRLNPDGVSPTEAEDRANRLYFSDPDEPESVPLLNYVDIGAQQSPILALVPLRNALLVFKSDGVWRVTGYGPTNWTVDPLDPTMRLPAEWEPHRATWLAWPLPSEA